MLMIYLAAIETDANKSKFETIYTEYRAIMFYVAKAIPHRKVGAILPEVI